MMIILTNPQSSICFPNSRLADWKYQKFRKLQRSLWISNDNMYLAWARTNNSVSKPNTYLYDGILVRAIPIWHLECGFQDHPLFPGLETCVCVRCRNNNYNNNKGYIDALYLYLDQYIWTIKKSTSLEMWEKR